MSERTHYTIEEIRELQHRLELELTGTELQYPGIRPLPPMEEEEARNLIATLAHTAVSRVLTQQEAFMIGQALAVFRMAVEARMLGKGKGRYFVISSHDIDRFSGKL